MRPFITDTLRKLAIVPVLLALLMAVPLQAYAALGATNGDRSVTDCNECDEKVVTVMLRYDGSAPARVVVRTDKKKSDKSQLDVYFDEVVQPGQMFAFTGDPDDDNKFGSNNLHIVVLDENDGGDAATAGGSKDSDVNVIAFHVSCSQPIVVGMDAAQQDEWDDGDENDNVSNDPDKGLFYVTGAIEKNGNALCSSPNGDSDDEDTCKLEGDDIGTPGVTVEVDGETVTVLSWIKKDDSPGEYVGFTLDREVENAVVKAGNMFYPFSGDSWTHPNGTSGPTAMAISNINFCMATVPDGDDDEPVGECLPEIDFETDGDGQPLAPGTIITNQFAAFGMTVSTNNPNKPAMLFGSGNPTGGDPDLGAPNEDFGGPGEGNGGGLNQPGANTAALGNVLIISEDGDSNDPDDNANGGTLIFEFDSDKKLAEVHILDVDNVEVAGIITAYDANNDVIESQQILALGDNSIQVVPFSATGVRKITVELPGSGAVARIVTCTEDPAPLGSIGDTIFEDTNGNQVQDGGEAGIPGVDVRLYTDNGNQLVEVTTTDANGNYLFDALPAGDYSVDVVDATVPAGLNLTTNNDPEPVTLAAGQDFLDADFGYQPDAPQGDPDIKVEKSSSQASVDLGDTFSYTLTATNVGGADASGVELTDTLPYGVEFVSATGTTSYDANAHVLSWTVGTLAASASTQITVTVTVDWMTGTFTGGFLQDGVYKLQNHPDGAVNPPFYGMRLDKLFGNLGPITFDFEHAQSDMRMRIEDGGQTIVIYGQTWGGRDTGSGYDFAGMWDVQFIYDGTVTPAPGDDDLIVSVESDRGTIIPRYTTTHFSANQVYELAPKFANGFSFRLGDEDSDNGHRGFDGISGWGWIKHNGNGTLSHKSTSDWLFTAHPAPDAFENCVELTGMNETDANAANNEACVTTPPVDPGANELSGTVFIDANQDGFLSGGESGQGGVTVNVYRDLNGNGVREGGEPLFDSVVTAGDGTYSVAIPTVGHFVIETDFPGSYPANASLTTDNIELAFFAGFGLTDTNNNFGFFVNGGGGDPDEIDLSLTKSADVAAVQVGGDITYTLTLANSSDADVTATGIEVWDTFPNALIQIQSVTPAAGVLVNNATGQIKWTVASLAPGASVQLTIVAEATGVGQAENCAEVGMATGSDTDSTPGNGVNQEDDSDCATVEITQDPPSNGASIGDFVFQDANNNGLQDAGEQGLGGILVRLYAGACGPNGAPIALRTTQPNGAYVFTGLPAGDYCVDVRDDTVPFGFVLSTGNDPMTVNLTSNEEFDDADFGYFYDPQLTTVDLELVKEVDTSAPALNENVTFTITIRNQGPGTATGVIVRDIIPVGLQFVSSNPSVGSYDPSKLGYWTIGTLEAGQTEVLTITTTVVITNMIENIAQVVAVDQPDIDSTPGNGVPDEDDQDNALVESRGPGAAGDITRAECADIGTINALFYEPNANVVLAGSQIGSVHISNDQGQNWPVAMQSNNNAAVTDIVGLADGSAIFASTFGDGVWRSVDGGETWSKYRLGTNKIEDLDLDELNNVLYAAADKKVMTIDLGTGSTATLPADPFGDQVLSLVYDDANSRLIAASAAAGVWKFESGSWTDVNSGLPIGKINAMIVTPAGMVLAGTNSDGVYVFGGSSWIQFGMGLDNDPIESFGLGGNGEILAGSRESGAYFYNQISGNWESIGNLPIFTVASMAAGAQGEVYAGAPGEGIYLIVDTDFDGIPDMSHQVANFMTNAVIQDMVVDEDGNIWAASFGYGVLFSSDGGNCWARMNRGLENLWTFAIDRTSDGTLFIGIWADGLGGIWRSTNNGQDWELVGFPTRQIISIAVDPNNEDIVYAGANLSGEGSIVVSTDGGDSWTQLQSFIQPVWAIRINPADSDNIVVGTLGDGVYESTDAGATWTQIGSVANGLADPNGFDLQFGPDGALYAATNRGVYRYDNAGGFPTFTWSLFGNGSEDFQFRTIEFVGSNIYGGTWNAGLVMYDSLTGDWTDLGLGDIPVIAFAVHELSQTLVIGTEGQGVYLNHNIGQSISTSVENVLVGGELPTSFGLDQNYPNPFASQTTLPFRLVNSEHVNVTVHDMLGREVTTLVDEVLQAGEHHARWTAEDLPSGTYLVRLRAGEHSFTRMVVLMK